MRIQILIVLFALLSISVAGYDDSEGAPAPSCPGFAGGQVNEFVIIANDYLKYGTWRQTIALDGTASSDCVFTLSGGGPALGVASLLAGGAGGIGLVESKDDLAGRASAVGKLNPALGSGRELDDADVLRIVNVLVDLHDLALVEGLPLGAAGLSASHVPVVGGRTKRLVTGRLNSAILMLSDLVLVDGDHDTAVVGLHNGAVDLVALGIGIGRHVRIRGTAGSPVEVLASSNDGIAQVLLERNEGTIAFGDVSPADLRAVRQLNPASADTGALSGGNLGSSLNEGHLLVVLVESDGLGGDHHGSKNKFHFL